jgi:flagella basal body P-ring formation protein FlgA
MLFSNFKRARHLLSIAIVYFAVFLASGNAEQRIVDGVEVRAAIVARLAAAGEQAAPNLLPEKQFYPCDKPLEIRPSFGSWRSVDVICLSPAKWKISVRAQVKGHEVQTQIQVSVPQREAVYLTRPMRRGDRLQASDVELRPVETLSSDSVYGNLDQVVGRVLSQSLTPSMAVMPRHLAKEWNVQEEDMLALRIVRGGIEILSTGIALEMGQMGDTIRVQSGQNGKILIGRIIDEKKVEIIAKGRN